MFIICHMTSLTSIIIFNTIMKWFTSFFKTAKEFVDKYKDSNITRASIIVSLVILIRKIITSKTISANETRALIQNISAFYEKLHANKIKAVSILTNSIQYRDTTQKIFRAIIPKHAQSYLQNQLRKSKINFNYIRSGNAGNAGNFILIMIVWALLGFMFYRLLKPDNQGEMNTSSKPQKIINFSNIIGLQESKQSLREIIQYMRNPDKFTDIGARMRKGIIFYGPSGTGKTTLAKATAGEANVPFYSCNASQFCEIYVGVGPKRVKDLFQKAKQTAPSIIYIDEIDAIGNRKNMGMFNDGAGSQKNSTINQLLSQMDGFASQQNILVIGSTNRLEMIDQSLLRAGRFDLKIKIPLPNEQDRYHILIYHLSSKKYDIKSEYLKTVAYKLTDWSGADIQNLANEAIYTSLRMGSKIITEQSFNATLKKLQQQQSAY